MITLVKTENPHIELVVATGITGYNVTLGYIERIYNRHYPHKSDGQSIGKAGYVNKTTAIKLIIKYAMKEGGIK
jgi:hypothetical protein